MDWFFGFNERSSIWFEEMIKVAVKSAKKQTNLKANCLYDGQNSTLIEWLKSNGVNVINTAVPFRDELFSEKVTNANKGSNFIPSNATGHFLRILVSDYANSENILYTDCDVMFLGDIDIPSIENVAVVEEVDVETGKNIKSFFNSGVMVFNKSQLSIEKNNLIEHFRKNNFFNIQNSSYDQFLLNEYYLKKDITYLDPIFNWRPFQGINANAKILHFHGPKPHRIKDILIGNTMTGEEHLLPLIKKDKNSYEYYLDIFSKYLNN